MPVPKFTLDPIIDPCGDFIAVCVDNVHVMSIVDNEEDGGLDLVSADGDFVWESTCTLAEILGVLRQPEAEFWQGA